MMDPVLYVDLVTIHNGERPPALPGSERNFSASCVRYIRREDSDRFRSSRPRSDVTAKSLPSGENVIGPASLLSKRVSSISSATVNRRISCWPAPCSAADTTDSDISATRPAEQRTRFFGSSPQNTFAQKPRAYREGSSPPI